MKETLGSKNEFEKRLRVSLVINTNEVFFREIKGNGFIHGVASLQLEVFP